MKNLLASCEGGAAGGEDAAPPERPASISEPVGSQKRFAQRIQFHRIDNLLSA